MATLANRVVEEALCLPADARLDLVERLLASLNPPLDEEIERLWAEETERRVSQIETERAKLVPAVSMFAVLTASSQPGRTEKLIFQDLTPEFLPGGPTSAVVSLVNEAPRRIEPCSLVRGSPGHGYNRRN